MIYENLRKVVKKWRDYRVTNHRKDFAITENLHELGEIGLHDAWIWGTQRDRDLLANGKITEQRFKARAIKQVERIANRDFKKDLEKITAVETAGTPDTIEIAIEWKKNRFYGYNPHASIVTPGGTYRARVSGCGYNKESAVVGQVLNLYPGALAIIYDTMEKALAQDNALFDQKVFGYGAAAAGYPLPKYQVNGVGLSSFEALFNRCGYDMNAHYRDGVAVWITITKREGATV